MRLYIQTLASCLTIGFTSLVSAADSPATNKDTLYLQTFGWFLGQQSGIEDLGLTPDEARHVGEGIAMAAKGDQPPGNPRDISQPMQQFLQGKAEAREKIVKQQNAKISQENQAKAEAFLADLKAKNKDNANFGVLPSGVCYEILTVGKGPQPTMKDSVKVNYKGELINGNIFDSNEATGEPIVFAMNGVIPGFSEGLTKINEGGKARLYIPSHLAYGDHPVGTIPAGSLLIFNVDLVKVNPEVFSKLGDMVPTTK